MRDYQPKSDYHLDTGIISDIISIASSLNCRSIHYVGYADGSLLKALKKENKYELSIMDMYNRTNRSIHFWNGDFNLNLDKYPIPNWMDGIVSYEEGAPDHDLSLRDIPWDWPNQFSCIVRFKKSNSPKHIILFGDADLETSHVKYSWDRRMNLTIGTKRGKL